MNFKRAFRVRKHANKGSLLRVNGLGLLTLLFLIGSVSAEASKSIKIVPDLVAEMECIIKIENIIYDTTSCEMNGEEGGAIRFGNFESEAEQGYWVYLLAREDGRYDAFWNEEFGATHAHSVLGITSRDSHGAGECFSNETALLCYNIPADTPIYSIEFRTFEEGGNSILAYHDGIEYEVTHPNSDILRPNAIGESADLDGDGRLETIISMSHGGNCCPPDISILSYRGEGFFTYIDEKPIAGGWGGLEIVTEAGRPIVRLRDTPVGDSNPAYARVDRDYAIINGRPQLVTQRREHGFPTEVTGLDLDEVKAFKGQRKQLSFDIDQDGQEDSISCAYWQRWGVLDCLAEISGASKPVELQCHRISVSPTVFGPNRSHRLLCDNDVVRY